MLQSHNLLYILDLLVLHDLFVPGIADIEWLSAQREHAEVVATDNAQTGDCERLGGVTLCEDQRAFGGLPGACVVGVGQFGQTRQPILLDEKLQGESICASAHLFRRLPSVFFIC